ncbi:MAG TPA: hybrid sensor histidine kinase/response regulator, partial [Polyangiaceae bacterium]|nr:hybrid sensor histidine kinase/response regulator [Polyangiaceae bacterium]
YVLHANVGGAIALVERVPADSSRIIAVCARTGLASAGIGEPMVLPLLIRGHAIGALALELGADPSRGEAGADRLEFLEAIVEQCALALERAHLYALETVRRTELEHSNRMKDDFLGIVSHELRTPLSAILGWARMLKKEMLASPVGRARALEAIERNAFLQARLVDDLLDVSRIVSGKMALETSSVDVAVVVEAAIDSVRPTALAKDVEIATSLGSERIVVLGDARRLQQAAWNLLTNAVKFTPARGRIEVALERTERVARIAVRDSGIGIPADVLPRVFERFKQADGSATRQYGGLGLGLSIVRHVIEAHGGKVRAQSEGEGRGTQMVIELPLAEADLPLPARPADLEDDRARLRGVRVLLVDGDEDSRELLATALEAAGAELRTVHERREALDAIGAWRPDVIVSDITTPDDEAFAFMREVRALAADVGGHTPALALTPVVRPADRVRALSSGFQTHLPKPVDPHELVQAVARLGPSGGTP